MENKLRNNILEYYNSCEWQYKMMWDLKNSMSISIGYFDETVKNFKQALQYQNEIFSGWLNIQTKEKVLDAGCGVGGSSIYLAKNIGCEVVGISIVPKQIKRCKENAIKHKVDNKTNFYLMDYHNMSFEDESFDVIWALESFCYALPKEKFIQEAFRVLKKGGRLLIVDLFQGKSLLSDKEHYLLYTKTMNPMAVESLDTIESVTNQIKEAGFTEWSSKNISKNVLFLKKRLQLISLMSFPFSKLGYLINWYSKREADSMLVGYYANKAYREKLTLYGVIIAIK